MIPGHRRQTQIIRLLAGATLAAFAVGSVPVFAQNRSVACVSCLVLAVDGATLAAATALPAGSLEGVQLLIDQDYTPPLPRPGGARIAVLVRPLPDGATDYVLYRARLDITAIRAEGPDTLIVIDGEAFTRRGINLDELRPYVDAVIGQDWMTLPAVRNPSVDTLVAASLTSGGERLVLPVTDVDWTVVQQFTLRAAALVEVTGARRLRVDEILARYQAQQHRQDGLIKTTIGTGTTTLLFEVPDFSAPITIAALVEVTGARRLRVDEILARYQAQQHRQD